MRSYSFFSVAAHPPSDHANSANAGPDLLQKKNLGQQACPKRFKGQKLLWVDDSQTMLSLYKAVFETLGFEVFATSSHKEALDPVSTEGTDVAILDYEMPEIDGIELACLVKDRHPSLPVILYSGSAFIPRHANDWVDAICAKAAPQQELLMTIERLTRNNRKFLA